MDDNEQTFEVVEVNAWQWRCRRCGASGELECDESLAEEMGWNHPCPSVGGVEDA